MATVYLRSCDDYDDHDMFHSFNPFSKCVVLGVRERMLQVTTPNVEYNT